MNGEELEDGWGEPQAPNGVDERRVCENERACERNEWLESLECCNQQRPAVDEREKLLRSRGRAEGPEARADAAGKHHGPATHVVSAPCSS